LLVTESRSVSSSSPLCAAIAIVPCSVPIALGFDEAQARAMVIGTLQGTIAMAAQSGEELETLRDSVTSKGGTTAAGLAALNGKGELSALLSATLEAAYDRAVELR